MYRGRVSSSRQPSRGQGRGGRSVYRGPQRDLEEELLMLINSDYQVNCTDVRPFEDILERVRSKPELYGYVYNSADSLREFIHSYSEFFVIDQSNPNVVRWTKTLIYSRRDPRAKIRQERRLYAKNFDKIYSNYDILLEENALSFLTGLFLIAEDYFLPLELIEKTVRLAFNTEVDLLDYAGIKVRAFMLQRDHVFTEHLDCMQFYGKNAYIVTQQLNSLIQSGVRGESKETISRLHDFYLRSPTISDEMRKDLRLDDRSAFARFISRAKFVFEYVDNVYVVSKRDIPTLTFNLSRVKTLYSQVLSEFQQMTVRKRTMADDDDTASTVTYLIDEDGFQRPLGQLSGSSLTQQQRNRGDLRDTASSARPSTRDDAHLENPFERRRLEQNANRNVSNGGLSSAMQSMSISVGRGRPVDHERFLRAPGCL